MVRVHFWIKWELWKTCCVLRSDNNNFNNKNYQPIFLKLCQNSELFVNFVEEEEDKLKVKSGFVSANFEEEYFAKLFEVEVLPLARNPDLFFTKSQKIRIKGSTKLLPFIPNYSNTRTVSYHECTDFDSRIQ